MKKIYLLFIVGLFSVVSGFAESKFLNQPIQDPNAEYRLFNTSNNLIFLKLDTKDGTVASVKLDIDGTIKETKIIHEGEKIEKQGTFTLYPTELPFIFLLLNQKTGQIINISWLEALN